MKKKILQSVLTFSVLIFAFSYAHAETILFVSPTRVNLDEKHKVEVMNLSNLSDIPRRYKISLEEYAMSEKGVTVLTSNFPYSAKKLIRFYPREVVIQPGQRQAVRVMAKIPSDLPDGQYHVHIKFFEDGKADEGGDQKEPNKTSIKVGMAYSAVMPITVSKGTIDTQVNWVDPKISYDDNNKIYRIDMELTRSGNGQGVAFSDVFYVAPDGTETQVGNRRTHYIYREIDKRNANIQFNLPEGASNAGKIKLRLLTSAKGIKPQPVNEMLLSIP